MRFYVLPELDAGVRTWVLLLAVVVLVISVYYSNQQKPLDMPIEESDAAPDGVFRRVQECYDKHRNSPYLLKTARPIVILPGCCIDDVKHLPESKASLYRDVHIDLSQAVTKIGGESDSPESLPAIRIDLTRRLNSAVPAMIDELQYALDLEFGKTSPGEWVSHPLHPKVTRIVALVNSRIFIGRPLSRSQEWLEHAVGYSIDVMRARHALNIFPYYLRLIVGRFLPEVRRLKWHFQESKKLLGPVLESLVSQDSKGLENSALQDDEFDDEQGTFCSWLLKYAIESRKNSSCLALNQLALSFVSTHTVGLAVTRAVHDLCARPEYILPLRDEIQLAIKDDGFDISESGSKQLKKTTYVKLRKVDSFLKESQRMFPSKMVSLVRISQSDLTLSTGHVLPAGTRFGIPVYAVQTSSRPCIGSAETLATDYVDPKEFDGFRFEKLRRLPGNGAKHQFVSTSNDSLGFGLGSHCCPGRFYAATVIKVIFVELLRNWDLRVPGDISGKGGSPPPLKINDFSISMDPMVPIQIRRRQNYE